MKEWKTIPEYPMYEASSDGEIRNKKTGRILIILPLQNAWEENKITTKDIILRK